MASKFSQFPPMLSNKRTVAFPVGANNNTPPTFIDGSVHNAANTVVFPVPASPTKTDILDFANISRHADFSKRAFSSFSVISPERTADTGRRGRR